MTSSFDWLMDVGDPVFEELLNPHSKPRTGICLEIPNNKAGTLTVRNANGHSLTIHVRPKIHDASIEGMLNVALDVLSDEKAELLPSYSSMGPSAWLSASFITLAKHYARSMRMEGVEREETLRSRVRGTVMVGAYVRNIPSRLQNIPCRFMEWTQDNQLNQHIKLGLNAAVRILRDQNLPHKMMEGKRTLRLFSGVSEQNLQRHVRERFISSLGPSQRHLRPLLQLANAIIDQRRPGNDSLHQDTFLGSRLFETGKSSTGTLEISWDLVTINLLFERYVANLLHRLRLTENDGEPSPYRGGLKKTVDWKYKLRQSQDLTPESPLYDIFNTVNDNQRRKGIELDAHPLKNGMLVDSKWKRGKVSNADLFQLVAYATHDKLRKKHTGLIFPQPSIVQHNEPYFSQSGELYVTEGQSIELESILPRTSHQTAEYLEDNAMQSAPAWIDLGHWEGVGGDAGIPVYVFQVRVDNVGIRKELEAAKSFHGLRSQIETIAKLRLPSSNLGTSTTNTTI